MGVEAPSGKAPVPRPGTNWGGGLAAGQSFFGAGGALDADLPLGALLFLHWEERGVGEAAAHQAQVGVHHAV